MVQWLLKLMGVGDEFLAHLNEARLAFQHPTLLWVGLALLVPVSVFIYGWQRRNLGNTPFTLRLVLSLTRIAVVALLVLVLAGPYLKLDDQNEKKPIVALLFDHSRSM